MNSMQRRGFLLRFAVLAAILTMCSAAFPFRAEASFGISPPFIHATHLVKGAKYTQVVYLVQDQPNEDVYIKADLKIPDSIRSWISIDKGFEFTIPKGTRQFPVEISVHV